MENAMIRKILGVVESENDYTKINSKINLFDGSNFYELNLKAVVGTKVYLTTKGLDKTRFVINQIVTVIRVDKNTDNDNINYTIECNGFRAGLYDYEFEVVEENENIKSIEYRFESEKIIEKEVEYNIDADTNFTSDDIPF